MSFFIKVGASSKAVLAAVSFIKSRRVYRDIAIEHGESRTVALGISKALDEFGIMVF